ncbi:MAG: hypothetical protein GW789_11150 [Ignavibacteria bacterium]|nr:hypothetical protein [Ignavibacteria bacterium]
MKLFVVNVGVNKSDASKRKMKSPIFSDKTFEFIPIKEKKTDVEYCDNSSRYKSIKCFNNTKKNLAEYLPDELHNYYAHNDPDFVNLTYGDVYSSRAGNLKNVSEGSIILFLARLYDYDSEKEKFLNSSSLYFVSCFEVEANLEFKKNVNPKVNKAVINNAHYKKLQKGYKKNFRIILGKKSGSWRFKKAIKITEEIAELLFNGTYDTRTDQFVNGKAIVNNKNEKPRKFENFAQITRSIQHFLDDENKNEKESFIKLLHIIKKDSR